MKSHGREPQGHERRERSRPSWQPTPLTKLVGGADSGLGHRAPEFLPDRRHFLYETRGNNLEIFGVYVESLDGTRVRTHSG